MQKHTRFWASLVAVFVVLSMVLGACNQATPTQAPAATQPQAQPTQPPAQPAQPTQANEPAPAPVDQWANVDPTGQTVVFWHPQTKAKQEALDAIIADFNATNPWKITVQGEYQGAYNDIYNKFLTFMNTSDAPGLVVAYQNQAATYQLADSLVDMNGLVDSAKWGLTDEEKKDFFPGFYNQDVFSLFNNQRLGFPTNRSMEVLYYNQDWLKELGYDAPPATPEQFKEMACKAAKQPFSKSTATDSYGFSFPNGASNFASFTFAMGGNIFDASTRQYTYDSDAAVAAAQMLQDLFNQKCAVLVDVAYGEQTDFATGRSLFTIGSSSGLTFYETAVAEGSKFAWSVGAIPHSTPDPVMNIYGSSISIPKTTPEKELAAWLFLKYWSQPEPQAKWAVASEYFPTRSSVAADMKDYFDKMPAYKTAFDMLKYGIFEPPVPGYDPVREKVSQVAAAIITGADVKTSLAALNKDANSILAEQMAMIPESPDPWAKVDPTGQTITFWHPQTKAKQEALDALVADFNATNPWKITVQAEYQGAYNDIYNKMLAVLNSPDMPDLVVAYQNQAATYQVGDALLDMNGLVNSYKWGLSPNEKKDFFPGFYNQDVFSLFNNQRLGFPTNRSMEVIYYNQDWLKELGYDAPPASPEQFKEMACKAAKQPFSKTQATDSYGFSFPNGASNFASLTFAMGGNIFDSKTGKYTYNSDAAVAAAQLLKDLFDQKCAVLVDVAYGEQTDFATGRSLFTIGSSSGLTFYEKAVAEGSNFAWSVGAIPHSTKDPVMNIYGSSISIPKTTPERELAAWLFLKYWTQPEPQAKWAVASEYFPVRASVADDMKDYFDKMPAYKTAFDMLKYGIAEPPVPGYDPVREKVSVAVAAIINGADIKTTLDTLTEEANAILTEQMTMVPAPEPTKAP